MPTVRSKTSGRRKVLRCLRNTRSSETKQYRWTFRPQTKKFEFEFAGYWQICESDIEYNRYEINQSSGGEFTRLKPIDPNEYWWFEEAKSRANN